MISSIQVRCPLIYILLFIPTFIFIFTSSIDYSMVKSATARIQGQVSQINTQAFAIKTLNCKAELWTMAIGYFTPNVTGTWNVTVSTDGMAFLWLGNAALEAFKDKNALFIKNNNYNYDLYVTQISLVSGTPYPLRFIYGNEGTSCLDFNITFTAPNNIYSIKDISNLVSVPEKYPLDIWNRPPTVFTNVPNPVPSIISFKYSLTYYFFRELILNGTHRLNLLQISTNCVQQLQ
jgi:hypothetical protein